MTLKHIPSGRTSTISEEDKIQKALNYFEEDSDDCRVAVLISKHNDIIRSVKVTIDEAYTEERYKERVAKTPYGEVTIEEDIGLGKPRIRSYREERFADPNKR